MKMLVIGGTRFLGRFITEEALRRNHEVTLFNRGLTNRGLFDQVETIYGDRVKEIERLGGRNFDSVIDTCGFVPWAIKPSIQFLSGKTGHYAYISSQSVYQDLSSPGVDEQTPAATLPPEKVRDLEQHGYGPYGEHYGAMKFLCEQLLEKEMPGRVLHVRAGLIVGPHDYTDRFSYWVQRVAEGGEILAPGRPEQPIQFIDVRDLARWVVDMAEQRQTGIFNATGPDKPLTMKEFLAECQQVSESDAFFTWVDEKFLLQNHVQPWTDLPLWLPERTGLTEEEKPFLGFFRVDASRAVAKGLVFRPLSETVDDLLKWLREEQKREWKTGVSREQERELLILWKQKEK
ncbi:NAD-dependent epimerase/dehydratase family protein [Paenactinomyces guangxiensis]|uniref:NAD-dependent epimerase/dehydratase family protein n=1 Tax=Paenactinomyces guangxiensis TaxID=1490290 RepID=A0A7W1WQV9_9BACL|nr:NAD-dependent epimerase/dehydratase family protein [Paenactinomyces guangxiensis]MBA4494201.1 NAD-dependent epimerase/dehydratase family protein [Paenactinomyces guangxiensis]MBH8590697.1 NAD-dependent epimerase/dehydratase family protein [Paenactinomyces guangxiensis]